MKNVKETDILFLRKQFLLIGCQLNGCYHCGEENMEKRLIMRYVIREVMGLIVMGVALFWSAG